MATKTHLAPGWDKETARAFKAVTRRFKAGKRKTHLTPGKDRPKTNSNGKYLKGAEAFARNRRINILHQCGLSNVAIAPHVKVTPARVAQILGGSAEKLYIVNFAELQDVQQKAFAAASTLMV